MPLRSTHLLLLAFLLPHISQGAAPSTTTVETISASYNVRDFGALGDGKNLDSPAIDRAI